VDVLVGYQFLEVPRLPEILQEQTLAEIPAVVARLRLRQFNCIRGLVPLL